MNLCRRIVLPLLVIATICACIRLSTGIANSAMSIDLGSEFLKLALIKPGVPMETVLNRDSQRKTPFAVTIKDGERFLGDAALKKAPTRAKNTYTFFLDLAGKALDDPAVTAFRSKFPYLALKAHPKRGTVLFETDSGEMSLECLLAMVLWNARQDVDAYAGQPVRDVVIAVPPYFGQAERAAVETAAKIADLNVLELLGSGSAAGLNYGVFRTKEITEQPQTLLIYDVGSTKTLATVVQFRLVKDEGNSSGNGTYPQVETIGVGYDRELGGHHLTLRMRDHLVHEFNKQYPSLGADITASPPAMAKLLKEANRVKQVLSANAQCFAHVESVFEDRDFRVRVTRDELEAMFSDLEQRHLEPINAALQMAQLSVDQIDRVVLMGAGTRVPRLQTVLNTFLRGKEIGRSLNTDEAAALGAVYHAARLSKRFIVKRFEVKELGTSDDTLSEDQLTKMTMDEEEIKEAKRILNEFERKERAKAEHALALNLLESAVYDYGAKLEEASFSTFGTEEELKLIREQVAQMTDWLDNMPDDIDVEELKQKRRDFMAPIRKLKNRKRQKEERPKLMDKLTKILDEAEIKLQLFNSSKEFFADGELGTFQQTVELVKVWFEAVKKELEQLEDNQDASFTTDDLKTKTNSIKGEMRSMTSKYFMAASKQREEAEAAAKKAKEAEAEAMKSDKNEATEAKKEEAMEEASKMDETKTDKTEEASKMDETKTDKMEEASKTDETKTDKTEETSKMDETKTDKMEEASKTDETKTDKTEETSKMDETKTDKMEL